MEKTKLAVVILNWNGRKLLEKFLPSVTGTLPDYAKLYVGDNASTDDSISFLNNHYPEIEIISNSSNHGFAEGYNQVLKKINAEYFVLINSDVETSPNWIEPIIDFMDKKPEVGACQPKILDYTTKELFEYAGAAGGFIDQLGFPFCRGRIFNELEKDKLQYEDQVQVFWATGACMFIRSSVFEEVGGLDKHFFAHMEEIDLCWRIQRSGRSIYCLPSSTVYHLGGGTLKKLSPKKTYLNFRNNLSMLIKNMHPLKLLLLIVPKLMLDGIAGVKFLLEGSPLHTISVLKSHVYMYLHLPRLLVQRFKLRRQLPYINSQTMYKGSIVWQHYISSNKTFSGLNFKSKNTK